jgi:hypothetical protein
MKSDSNVVDLAEARNRRQAIENCAANAPAVVAVADITAFQRLRKAIDGNEPA